MDTESGAHEPPNESNENEDVTAENLEMQPFLPPAITSKIRERLNEGRKKGSGLIKIIKEVGDYEGSVDDSEKELQLSVPWVPRGWVTLGWTLLLRLIQLSLIGIVFWLGINSKSFNLKEDRTLYNISISIDFQLAIFGLLNKVLDYLLENVLEHAVSVVLTLWLACSISTRYSGIGAVDLAMKDEMSKPWLAVGAFYKRCRRQGWRWQNFFRFLVALLISLCVLLQGVGVNTIGIPKQRWYPNYSDGVPDESLTLATPLMRIVNTNWDGLWGQAVTMIGEDNAATGQVVAALSASQTFLGILNLRSVMNSNQSEPGWYEIFNDQTSYLTAIDVQTQSDDNFVRTVSLQNIGINDMWNQETKTGNDWARDSTGWTGLINVTLPFLETTCSASASTQIANETMLAQRPLDINSTDATLALFIGASTNFTGATCSIKVRQGLFSVGTWIIDNTPAVVSLTNFNQPSWLITDLDFRNPPLYFLDPTPYDTLIASNTADMFNNIYPNFANLIQRGPDLSAHFLSLVHDFVSLGRMGLDSDARAFAPIVGATLSHILTMCTWDVQADAGGAMTKSAPVRYQVYAASPRMTWEWAVGAVLGGVAIFALYDMYLIVRYRFRAAEVTNPSTLLMRRPRGVEKLSDGEKKDAKFFLREKEEACFLTVDQSSGKPLKRDATYKWMSNVVD